MTHTPRQSVSSGTEYFLLIQYSGEASTNSEGVPVFTAPWKLVISLVANLEIKSQSVQVNDLSTFCICDYLLVGNVYSFPLLLLKVNTLRAYLLAGNVNPDRYWFDDRQPS